MKKKTTKASKAKAPKSVQPYLGAYAPLPLSACIMIPATSLANAIALADALEASGRFTSVRANVVRPNVPSVASAAPSSQQSTLSKGPKEKAYIAAYGILKRGAHWQACGITSDMNREQIAEKMFALRDSGRLSKDEHNRYLLDGFLIGKGESENGESEDAPSVPEAGEIDLDVVN